MLLEKNGTKTGGSAKRPVIHVNMTTCSICESHLPPIKDQPPQFSNETKKYVSSINPTETTVEVPTEDDPEKISKVIEQTLFYSDAKKVRDMKTRRRRSIVTIIEEGNSTFNADKKIRVNLAKNRIEVNAPDLEPRGSDLMTQAIMKGRSFDGSDRLDRVAHVVTNIVHSPRSPREPSDRHFHQTRFPNYESHPYGVSHNRLIIRPAKYRTQYRFPAEPAYYSGAAYPNDYYHSLSTPSKYRNSKKLPTKVIDVHDNHDTQYEYVEMDVTHDGKQIPRKPPKYMRGRPNGGYKTNNYRGFEDYFYKQPPRPAKSSTDKSSYYSPKESYPYQYDDHSRENDDSFDQKRSPDYSEGHSGDGRESGSHEDDRHSESVGENPSDASKPYHYDSKQKDFIPSQPYPIPGGHYYQSPKSGPKVVAPHHRFIPVPKTLEEYHKLHGTKFLNSYQPEEDDEFTFHYPNDSHDESHRHFDEEDSSAPHFSPPSPSFEGFRSPKPSSPSFEGFRSPKPPSPSFEGFRSPKPPSPPSFSGFNEPKTPTSFMSVAFGKQSSNPEETRVRLSTSSPKLSSNKLITPQPSTHSESYEADIAPDDEISSKELQSFLDSVKTQVYDDKRNLGSDYKTDSIQDVDPNFSVSVNPYEDTRTRKKSKDENLGTKHLLGDSEGNNNKRQNYRRKNNYYTSGNSNLNFNNRKTYSNSQHGLRNDENSGFGFKEHVENQDSLNKDLRSKNGGLRADFKQDLFGKDRMKILIPSEGSRQSFNERGPHRHSRRVKIRKVPKKDKGAEENESAVKLVVANPPEQTTTENVSHKSSTNEKTLS